MGFCDKGGAAFSSETNEWSTPQDLFDELNEEFGFTIDVAATAENAKCERYYTAADDGLKQSWGGESVFCNPPYGRQIGRWVEKAAREAEKPGTTVVLLIPSRTDTSYFHDFLYRRAEIRFIRGRIRFTREDGATGRAPFPSMVAIFRSEQQCH